jgi:hypothetical protein
MKRRRARRVPISRATGGSDYEVGYGRPPKKHQFKPGRSSNPKGRPKGAKNEATIFNNILNRRIEIRESGKRRKITVLEAMLLKFTEQALRGNPSDIPARSIPAAGSERSVGRANEPRRPGDPRHFHCEG